MEEIDPLLDEGLGLFLVEDFLGFGYVLANFLPFGFQVFEVWEFGLAHLFIFDHLLFINIKGKNIKTIKHKE